jgi:hypothetical protein
MYLIEDTANTLCQVINFFVDEAQATIFLNLKGTNMKLILFLFAIFLGTSLSAQYTPPDNFKHKLNQQLWTSPEFLPAAELGIEGSFLLNKTVAFRKARLLELKESSVVLLTHGKAPLTVEVPIEHIETFKFRRKGSKTIGLVTGAATGLLVGAIIESLSSSQRVCRETSSFWTFLGAGSRRTCHEKKSHAMIYSGVIGGLAGWTIGSVKKKIEIHKYQPSYERQRRRLEQYLLVQ